MGRHASGDRKRIEQLAIVNEANLLDIGAQLFGAAGGLLGG